MPNIFFSSDHHFYHRNIIVTCNRPFIDIDDMNNALIQNHNMKVTNDDIEYFLGDFIFKNDVNAVIRILKQMNRQKHFICGNHDKIMYDDRIREQFVSFTPNSLKEIRIGNKYITLSHYAMFVWNKSHHNSLNLFGHSHGMLSQFENSQQLDVGVDCWDYAPVSLDEIKEKLKTLPIRDVDRRY